MCCLHYSQLFAQFWTLKSASNDKAIQTFFHSFGIVEGVPDWKIMNKPETKGKKEAAVGVCRSCLKTFGELTSFFVLMAF